MAWSPKVINECVHYKSATKQMSVDKICIDKVNMQTLWWCEPRPQLLKGQSHSRHSQLELGTDVLEGHGGQTVGRATRFTPWSLWIKQIRVEQVRAFRAASKVCGREERERGRAASVNKRCGLTFSIRIRSRYCATETALQKASKATNNNLISVLHQKAEEEEAVRITSEKNSAPHTQNTSKIINIHCKKNLLKTVSNNRI